MDKKLRVTPQGVTRFTPHDITAEAFTLPAETHNFCDDNILAGVAARYFSGTMFSAHPFEQFHVGHHRFQ
jgi:hypothetical protein